MTEYHERGIQVDRSALADYSARTGVLAEQVRQVAVSHLAGNRTVPEDCFGDVGQEAGVHVALSTHIGQLHDDVHRSATSVAGLGNAVAAARDDYQADEQDKVARFRGLRN